MRSELTFSTVLTAYGLTESTGIVTMCRRGDDPETIAETSGRAIPGLEVRVVDDDGVERPRGEPGEIVVRGYTVVSGYFEDPEATAEAIDAEGWLHTGDIGVMDDAGNVRITDRKKDMFIVGGFNAYPAEIEGALLRHPGVAQVAVVGVPDERMGEVGCAFVVPRPGADAGGPGRRARGVGPRPDGQLQGAPPRRGGRRPAHQRQWQGAQDRAARAFRAATCEGSLMRGIVYTGDDAEVTDKLGIAEPGPTEVKVKIVAAGVCHSDLSVLDGTIPWKAPSVLGHEGAGIVEAVGSSVRSVKPGDHVVVATLASCGTCRACNTGHPTMCIRSLGNVSTPFTYDGEPASNFAAASVFAEYTIIQEVQAVPISKDVPFTSACLIGCGVLTGVGSVLNRAKVAPGETAAVFGVGGVGLNVIQALRLSAASRIVAVDTMASKEDLARQFGATHFVDASKADAVEEIKKIVPHGPKSMARALGPGGVTWAFDCVGHPPCCATPSTPSTGAAPPSPSACRPRAAR